MATTTLSVIQELLKEVYEPKVRDQLQSEAIATKRLEQSSAGVGSRTGGKYVRFTTRIKRNHGIGARAENTALPAARSQKYQDAQVDMTYLYGAIELTGPTIELADSDYQAFAGALDQEINGLRESLKKDMNRQAYGTSAGTITTANAAGTTTTIVVANKDAIYLEDGMIIDIWDASGAALMTGGPFEITDIAEGASNTTVTFTGAAGLATASGDTVHRHGSRNLETIGLKEIISDSGTLYNIDPTTVGLWKSVVDDNGGVKRPLSESRLIKMVDDIRTKGGKTTVIFTTLGVRRAYYNLLQQQRRYTNTQEFSGGFKGLAFATDNGDVPMIADFDCQKNRLYFVNEEALTLYKANDWSWMNRDGSMWQRKIKSDGTYDAYEATMYKYCQLGTDRRNTHGLVDDIEEAD